MRKTKLLMAMAVISLVGGCSSHDDSRLDENKELVTKFNDFTNAANWEGLEDVVVADFKRHSTASPGEPVTSLEQFVALQKSFLVTFPDQHVSVHKMIAEGDHVAVRATYAGTQTGQMGEIPPTGRSVSSPFIAMFRIEAGKIAEIWVEWDNLAIMSQLGVFPPPDPETE